jgi:hypothetical protein
MDKLRFFGCALAAALVFTTAEARDERLKMPVAEAMDSDEAKAKLGDDVKFFFGSQASPKPKQTLGTFTSNKKTNFANKSDQAGCTIAFLSAMIALKERAIREGGNAVINIHSVYKNETFKSETEYECGAGKILGGVALRGTVVKL